MPGYKHHGKNIKKLERITGKLMTDLVLEATAFDTLYDYAVALCRHYRLTSSFIRGTVRTLRSYAIEKYGRDWCQRYYETGGQYLATASQHLGVSPDRVVEHLMNNNIDLGLFTKKFFPKNSVKAYNFFYTRISRVG